jgi:plasmid stabilization system protein ParE
MLVSDKTANKIKKAIYSATRPLSKQPFIGTLEENLIDLEQEHRYLVEGNYKIIYRIIDKNIYITDIFDCRQNPTRIKNRLTTK